MENKHLLNACKWLSILRKGSEHYDVHIERFREAVKNGKITFAQIGTDEEELAELKILGHETAAKMWLEVLRNGTADYNICLHWLREEVIQGNLTFKRIGTSEEELTKLALKGSEVAANEWLGYMRSGAANYHACMYWMREEMRRSNLTLARLGTSKKELTSLRRKNAQS